MKFKTSWFNGRLFANTLSRYRFLAVINGICFFFALPLAMLIMLRNDPTNQLKPVILSFYGMDFTLTRLFSLLAMVMGFAGGLTLFAYLHQPRQVNFYHAQPVSRTLLLTHRLLTGALSLIIPYWLNVALSLIIVAAYGGLSLVPWLWLLASFGYVLLGYLSMLAFSALAAQLTGTIFAQAEVTLYLLFLPPLASLAIQVLMGRYLYSYVAGPLESLLLKLSPLAHLGELTHSQVSYPESGWILYQGVLMVCVTAACYLIYRRRPLERAGQAVTYRCVGTFLRLSGAVFAGLFLGQFFSLLTAYNDYVLMAIGTVLGLLLWNMLCQVQIFHSSRAAFRGLKSLAAALVICGVVLTIMISGCFGYDRYLPSAGSLSRIAVNVNCPGMPNQTDELDLSGQENIELAIRLVAQSQQAHPVLGQNPSAQTPVDTDISGEEERYLSVEVTYYPQFGFPTSHIYHGVSLSAIEDPLGRLLQTKEYLAHHVLLDPSLQVSDYTWNTQQSSISEPHRLTQAVSESLVDAYRQDLSEHGIVLGDPVYTYISAFQILGSDSFYLPVYGSYARTLTLLEEAGLYQPLSDERLVPYVECIEVTRHGELVGTITDPNQIAQTLSASVCQNSYTQLETSGLASGYQLRVVSQDVPENPWQALSYYEQTANESSAILVCYLTPIRGQVPLFLTQMEQPST